MIRLLLTYLPSRDFLRVTKVCRWLYTIGTDPAVFANCCPVELALEPSTNMCKLHERMQRELSLIVHESDVQVKGISVDKYALHVEEFDSRIVRFWWGYRKLDVCEGDMKLKFYDLSQIIS